LVISKKDIHEAIESYPNLYEDRKGGRFIGEAVSGIPGALRNRGWRRVGRKVQDPLYLCTIGCEIREAQYIGGARPTGRFVQVVFVREWPNE